MTKQAIIDAYSRIRTNDNTIPDDVLDFMKEAALEKIKQSALVVDLSVLEKMFGGLPKDRSIVVE